MTVGPIRSPFFTPSRNLSASSSEPFAASSVAVDTTPVDTRESRSVPCLSPAPLCETSRTASARTRLAALGQRVAALTTLTLVLTGSATGSMVPAMAANPVLSEVVEAPRVSSRRGPQASPAPSHSQAPSPAHRAAAAPSAAGKGPTTTVISGVSALQKPGTSSQLDGGRTYHLDTMPSYLSFGHHRVEGQFFDDSGNWVDTRTAVTSDQFAAMPAAQMNELLNRAHVDMDAIRYGNPWKATFFPAVGTVPPGQRIDTGRDYDARSQGIQMDFGHQRVAGSFFEGNRWKDTRTLVSADQVAAMGLTQRESLARSAGVPKASLRLGDWHRVIDPVDAQALDRILDAAARKHGVPPNVAKAVAWKESTWNHAALSFDGQHGKGLMQIDDRYHDFAFTPEVFDPVANADYGCRYLAELKSTHGSWYEALAAYNGSYSYADVVMGYVQAQPWRARLTA